MFSAASFHSSAWVTFSGRCEADLAQSNFIALALFFAFFVFITTRGELPRYLAVFGLGGQSGGSGADATGSTLAGIGGNALNAFGTSAGNSIGGSIGSAISGGIFGGSSYTDASGGAGLTSQYFNSAL